MRFVLIALLLVSCRDDARETDGGTPGAQLSLRLLAHGQPAAVTLDQAEASFEEIRVVGDAGDVIEATTAVNLLDEETIVVIEGAVPGVYSRVRLRLGPDEVDTLSVDGRFRGTPLRFRAREEDEIDLRSPEGRRLDPGGEMEIVIEIDRSRWFLGVDLEEAEIEGGVIDLDPDDGRNDDLAEDVFEGILGSFVIQGMVAQDAGLPDELEMEDGGDEDGGEDEDGGDDDGGDDDGGPEDAGID